MKITHSLYRTCVAVACEAPRVPERGLCAAHVAEGERWNRCRPKAS